jgi:hypothetical protein
MAIVGYIEYVVEANDARRAAMQVVSLSLVLRAGSAIWPCWTINSGQYTHGSPKIGEHGSAINQTEGYQFFPLHSLFYRVAVGPHRRRGKCLSKLCRWPRENVTMLLACGRAGDFDFRLGQ